MIPNVGPGAGEHRVSNLPLKLYFSRELSRFGTSKGPTLINFSSRQKRTSTVGIFKSHGLTVGTSTK